MKNVRILFFLILALAALAGVVVYKLPTHQGLDIQGGLRVVLQAETDKLPRDSKWDQEKLELVTGIMRRRVDFLGVAEPLVYPMGQDRIVVELPGLKNKDEALRVIQSTATLEFRYVPELDNGIWQTREGDSKEFADIINNESHKPVSPEELDAKVFSKDPILTGAQLKPNARPDIQPTGKTVIHFEFQEKAKQIFEDFTRSHIGKRLAVFLDKKLITAPVINDVIPGEGIIEGNFTPEAATTLANQLNAGALPVPLQVLQKDLVEATLGAQAVRQTIIAGVVGLALVLLFMLLFYRLPGFLADIALCLYALFTFAIFNGAFQFLGIPPVTLTVPGIAGFILSIGMAVDANILIFERMKEERRSGKSLRSSIETGFKRAITAIVDSNACTLITCGVLYQLGTGQVRGFALTLGIGVIVSLFTAITCTRTFLLLVAESSFGQNDKLYSLTAGLHPKLQVTRRMAFWFGLSGLVIIPGLIAWGVGGIKPSIEFTGGTETTVQFSRPLSASQISSSLAAVGHKEAHIVLAEGNKAFITTARLENQAQTDQVRHALEGIGGAVQSESTVSGTISSELKINAVMSVMIASALIVLYLALRFSLPNFIEGLKFGTCAIIALLHDVLVLWGSFAILGLVFNWQIDSLFVTAMLTVIGFSVHDTIIIFDRMRENLRHKQRGETFADVADRSIEQTFARSVYTSGTVLLTLLSLLLFGGPVIKTLVTALFIGIISGTYSSIFNATPLLVLWRRLTGDRAPATAAAGPATASSAARPTPRRAETPIRPSVPATPRPAPNGVTAEGGVETAPSAQGGAARVQPKKRKQRRM